MNYITINEPEPCLICERPVDDYEPEWCCSGIDCGCHGVPINPCTCSAECDKALFDYIGMPYEERRIAAGIAKFKAESE